MCGICGFVGAEDPGTLERMADRIAHRGPDGSGYFSSDGVSLGHRRLSIIDLEGGAQPISNEDGTVHIVFNGEIYNHRDLRRELQAAGHQFKTAADTESIVHAYEEFGVDCVNRLDGMFAFVLFDSRRRRLFGARDRFGKKPLYYTTPQSGSLEFAFASELKSLREHPSVAKGLQVDARSLCDYLLNDYVVGERSIFEGIARLLAGCAFTYGLAGSERPGFHHWRYWDISLEPMQPVPSFDEAADHILELLKDAVGRRLMADVPLGTFLSGGIDSSAIVAMLTQLLPVDQIQTFSIAFDEASFDESAYAQQVARRFGVKHHVKRFSASAMVEVLPGVVDMLDEPFADPSVLPVSMLCRFAREHVTVALGGDGGDELFAGYDPFRAIRWANWYSAVPESAHAAARWLARRLPASSRNMSLRFKAERFLRGSKVCALTRSPVWMGPFEPVTLRRVAPELASLLTDAECYQPQRSAAGRLGDPYQQAIDFFERFYLVDDILVKVDRASMLHSLEVRAPFLDTRLAEYVNALPVHYKLRGGQSKAVLKHALAGKGRPEVVPRSIVHRSKKGFGIPVARWIKRELRDQFRAMLLSGWPTPVDVFDRRQVERLLDDHVRGKENNYKELWALYMLAHWSHRHLS